MFPGPYFLNLHLIPRLCKKAGVPERDLRGKITSHRARSTIATQLFNAKEPMSLCELQEWLGPECSFLLSIQLCRIVVRVQVREEREHSLSAGTWAHPPYIIYITIGKKLVRIRQPERNDDRDRTATGTSSRYFACRSKMRYPGADPNGNASRNCWMIQLLVGCFVTLKCRMRRRLWLMTKKQ